MLRNIVRFLVLAFTFRFGWGLVVLPELGDATGVSPSQILDFAVIGLLFVTLFTGPRVWWWFVLSVPAISFLLVAAIAHPCPWSQTLGLLAFLAGISYSVQPTWRSDEPGGPDLR